MTAEKPLKIIVCGEDGTGKTTLCRKFMKGNSCDDLDPYVVFVKDIEVDNVIYTVEVTDAPGSDLFIPRMEAEVPNADGFILVFSLTSRDSFLKGKKLLPHVWKHKEEKRFPIVVVANKVDLRDKRVLRYEDGYNLAVAWYGSYREITASNLEQVMDVFVTIVREIIKPPEERKSPSGPKPVTKNACCCVI